MNPPARLVTAVLTASAALLLTARSADAGEQLFGVRLPRTSSAGPAGRGILIQGGAVTQAQAVIDG